MRTAGRIYDFTLTAGGSMQLLVQGDYMRIMSSTGAVEVLTDHYRIGPIMAGQGQAKSPFTRLTIIDRSGAGNVGNVLVADSDFIDNRINGEVSVIDGGRSRTVSDNAFFGNVQVSGVSLQFAVGQIYNPTGSGKRVIIESLSVASSVAMAVDGLFLSAPVGTLSGSAPSKLSGGTASVAQLWRANQGSNPPGVGSFEFFISASLTFYIPFKEPLVLLPGYALAFVGQGTGGNLVVNSEFYEELI